MASSNLVAHVKITVSPVTINIPKLQINMTNDAISVIGPMIITKPLYIKVKQPHNTIINSEVAINQLEGSSKEKEVKAKEPIISASESRFAI